MKTIYLILLLICCLSLTHQLQMTIRDRFNYIESKFDDELEQIDATLEIIINENKNLRKNFEEFKQHSIKEQSHLREKVNEMNIMFKKLQSDNENRLNDIKYEMDVELLKNEEFGNQITETKMKIEEIPLKVASKMNDFKLKFSNYLLANQERINATIDKKVEAMKRLFNETLQSSLRELRKHSDVGQQKQANSTLSNLSSIKSRR